MNIMLIAEAAVTTDRASRYLTQLCEHLEAIARPPADARTRRMVR
jgi:hypothetical protein